MKRKLTKEENIRLVLKKKIEEVLFNEQKLITLKDLTQKVSTGEIPAKVLRETIIKSKGRILEELLDKLVGIFKFYAHQTTMQDQLSEFTSGSNSQIAVDLQEKNELLEKVANKLNHIYEKVKNKVEVSI